MIDFTFISPDFVLLFGRLIAAWIMLYFGWPKVRDLKSNAKDFVGMGFKPGWLFGTIMAFTEVLGGLAILFGFLITYAAAAYGFAMIVGAIWKIKIKKGFPDWSYDLLLLALMLFLVSFGAGAYAVLGY